MMAIQRRIGTRRDSALVARPSDPPYLLPGYRRPIAPTAAELMRKTAKWPLVWVTDIHSFDSISSRTSGQSSFSLTQPGEQGGGAGASFQCRVPLHEGDLFEKDGAYVVVVLPAADSAQVEEILRLAGKA
jgi:hypothetical protein